MSTQIVMDHLGDSRHTFDPKDLAAASKAEQRFNKLLSEGYTAAVRDKSGEAVVTRSFDASAEETVFIPRLVGG